MKTLNKYLFPLLSLLLGLILAYPYFGNFIFSPNKFVFAFGGDPLVVNFDIAYQACHGGGKMFYGMNYPNGELIYMTAAQGVLGNILAFINKNIFNVCDCAIGTLNSLLMLNYFISIILFYLILKSFNIQDWRAAIYSALAALSSPQIDRMIGHSPFAYSSIILMAILWMLRKYRIQKIEKRDLAVFLILLFSVFNDVYVGSASCIFIISSAFVWLLLDWYKSRNSAGYSAYRQHIYTLALGLSPLIIFYFYLKANDPYNDRIKLQWGYYDNKSTLEGLFFAPGSLIDKALKFFVGKGFNTNYESIANLGFPIIISLIGFLIVRLLFKKSWKDNFKFDRFLLIALVSCGLVFLYTSTVIFAPFDRSSVENFLGELMMFKANARISWPLWYILVIIALYLLEQYLSKLSFSGYAYTIVLVLLTWYTELSYTKKPRFKDTTHPNTFSSDVRNEMNTLLKQKNIKVEDYQAILMLPKLMAWTDMFVSENGFWNQFIGSKLSFTTGLPIVNATLSRMSVGETAEKIEFLSHPLIEKSLHKKFPNNKKIMIVVGKSFPALQTGEKYLVSLSDTLHDDPNWSLLSLDLNKLNKYPLLDSLRNNLIPESKMANDTYLRLSYDDQKNTEGYRNTGGFYCKEGLTELSTFSTPNPIDSFYTFSAWTKIQWRKYGAGEFIIETFDKSNNKLGELRLNNSVTNDISDLHSRVEGRVRTCIDCKYKISFYTTAGHYIDEVLFTPSSIIYHDPKTRIYQGFGY